MAAVIWWFGVVNNISVAKRQHMRHAADRPGANGGGISQRYAIIYLSSRLPCMYSSLKGQSTRTLGSSPLHPACIHTFAAVKIS